MRRARCLIVQSIDAFFVFFFDGVSFEFEGWGEQAIVDRKLVECNGDFLRAFVAAEIFSHLLDFFEDGGIERRIAFEVGSIDGTFVLCNELVDEIVARTDENDVIWLSGAENDGVFDMGRRFEFFFERARDDVFSVFEFELFFDAPGEEQIAIFVDIAEIARFEFAIGEDFGGEIGEMMVCFHDALARDDDFADAICI